MSHYIAVVEDEPVIAANLSEALQREGFTVRVFPARQPALDAFRRQMPDLAIVDIGLGDEAEGGFELCRELRALSRSLPLIFLSARDSDIDVVSGLRLGADDYLSKDTSSAQLMARVRALLRRVAALQDPEQEQHLWTEGQLTLNTERMTVHWREQPVPLTVTEFWMVFSLASRPGRVRSREQLMTAANAVLDDTTVTSHIKRIRRKFVELDAAFDAIETAYGIGYRWAGVSP